MSHLANLHMMKVKHRALDNELSQASSQLVGDDLTMKRMKRQKLLLKDKIVSIEATIRAAFS